MASNKEKKKEESTSRRSRTESLRLGSGGQTQGLAFILGLHSRRLSLSQVYRGSAISILGVSICCTLGFAPNICGHIPHQLPWIKKWLQMAFFTLSRKGDSMVLVDGWLIRFLKCPIDSKREG